VFAHIGSTDSRLSEFFVWIWYLINCSGFYSKADIYIVDDIVTQMALFENLLKKEGEIVALKAKALQLIQSHEKAVGYDDITQQLQQLGNFTAFNT